MSRRLNTAAVVDAPVRTRNPRSVPAAPVATPEMIALARDAFHANKLANAATALKNAKMKDLSKAMAKADLARFEFMGQLANGSEVRATAEIAPIQTSVISVEILRTLVDDATFMRVIKATQGDVKDECGEHILNKALKDITKPAELKITEVK